jgi:aminoglycoside phosphotransferase (APT) family kinase protein
MSQFQTIWQSAKNEAIKNNLKVIEYGWEQHVIIDEKKGITYRYPRHAAAQAKLKDEVIVLEALQQAHLPVATPKLIALNEHYSTYQLIKGEALTPDMTAQLTAEQADQLGRDLGVFLAAFHTLDPSILSHKITTHSTSLFEYYSERITQSPKSAFTTSAINLLNDLRATTDTPQVVLHGDLHGLNIIVDPTTMKLVGVIDISEMELGDPHQEFRKIFMSTPDALNSAIKAYNQTARHHINVETVKLWAYVNEFANACFFADQPQNATYLRAIQNLTLWNLV